jgi:hypothetical protein
VAYVRRRRRGLELAGLALGIAAGVGVAAGWLVPALHHLSGPPPVNSRPVVIHAPPTAVFDAGQLSSAGHGSRYGATTHPAVIALPSYTPPAGGSPVLGGAAVLRLGDTVYVYGTQSPRVSDPFRHLYLARVPASQLTTFSSWRFYAGAGTWATGQQDARPVPLSPASAGVSSGFSVVRAGGRYWLIQAGGAGTPDIDAYPAAAPWGPFDFAAGRRLYRDPSIGLDDAHDFRIMYEARAEPALSTGTSLVIRLSWPEAGLGVRYLIYLQGPGRPGVSPVTRTYRAGATFSGLPPGRYVARVVPGNFRKYKGRGARVTFTVR